MLPAGPALALAGAARDDANVSGDLDVTSVVTIQGAGASLTTIDANGVDRAIDVRAGAALTVTGVTITGGRAPNGGAGAAHVGMDGREGGKKSAI